ncbi:hypothetical protein MLD52_11510 [Puniceicoccaceae bacterium K14]|nr:hypothetical protein [Puniceicoccaceae bacterium K14]
MKKLKINPIRLTHRVIRKIKKLGKQRILVLGDSHARVFNHNDADIPGYWFDTVAVGGATVSGLKNPNSVTQAMPIFGNAIETSNAKVCITLLGEVDTGFVIWYRSKKYNINVNEMLDQAVRNYIEFTKNISRSKHVVIVSCPLPTIQDNQDWGEIANLRKEVTATQKERTDLTIEFNSRMESFAEDNGISFINLDSVSLNEAGVIKSELLNSNKYNHHYDRKAYVAMLLPRMEEILKGLGRSESSKMEGRLAVLSE